MGLLNVPSPLETHSDIPSKLTNSLVHTGTILISASLSFCVTSLLEFMLIIYLGIQYCDGIRGGFVIYDGGDPHRSMYDGKQQN